MRADWKKSMMKFVQALILFTIGVVGAGLTAQPELGGVYGAALVGILNFVKHEWLVPGAGPI